MVFEVDLSNLFFKIERSDIRSTCIGRISESNELIIGIKWGHFDPCPSQLQVSCKGNLLINSSRC